MNDGKTQCPICGRDSAAGKLAPFCSLRCADVDLGRWFTEAYRVPAEAPDEVDPPEPVR